MLSRLMHDWRRAVSAKRKRDLIQIVLWGVTLEMGFPRLRFGIVVRLVKQNETLAFDRSRFAFISALFFVGRADDGRRIEGQIKVGFRARANSTTRKDTARGARPRRVEIHYAAGSLAKLAQIIQASWKAARVLEVPV